MRIGPPRRHGAARILLLGLALTAATGCIIEAPYVSFQEHVPFEVTLTEDLPVAIRDFTISIDRTAAASYSTTVAPKLYLADIDPRVRVVVFDQAGTIPGYLSGGYVGGGPGFAKDLAVGSDCPDPCTVEVRVLFELTEPLAGETVAVAGEIQTQVGYPGSQTPLRAFVSVEGLDAGQETGSPETRSATIDGDAFTLDANHPIELRRVRLQLDPGADLDLRSTVSGGSIRLDADTVAAMNVGVSVYRADNEDADVRSRVLSLKNPQTSILPFKSCPGADPCDLEYVVRFAWMGDATSSQRVSWDLDAFVAGYGDAGLPDDVEVTATSERRVHVPDGAPVLSRVFSGQMTLRSGNRDDRANSEFMIRLTGLRPEVGNDVIERPGVGILTFSATGRDGPLTAEKGGVRLLAQNLQTDGDAARTNEILTAPDFVADGISRSTSIQLLADCTPDADCEIQHLLTLFQPEGFAGQPITLDWTLEVRATSFETTPLGAGADITFEIVPRDR